MPRVFVEPIGLTLEVGEQETLFDGLVRAAVDIPTDCAGRGTCGKCLVRVGSGELTAPTERELKRISEKLRAEGWRLACQASPRSARVSIEVRGTAGQRRILTTSKLRHGAAHPAVVTRMVELEPPTLADARSDLERFDEA
ncbi:MAG: 2Fe-2S iron-sulfur cluster binding domain-containing protein, partial [Actinobacteria bacterium]|nr:2Fe-2S iron-sulfur cluster binding domain-containing protein [Actinomycetota bacterium]